MIFRTFTLLVSEKDFYLMWERGHHDTNDGFRTKKNIRCGED